MEYVAHQKYKGKALTGDINIPAMSRVDAVDGLIWYNGLQICTAHSDIGTKHFCRNDDGRGMERGALTREIISILRRKPDETQEQYQSRWDKIWEDSLSQKYKRISFADYWLWNDDFFNAPIEDLQHILKLI